jgi:hypothetical protein
MSCLEDELNEIEKYIETLEINDDTHKEVNDMIKDGMEKGLIYDFIRNNYRATLFSSKVINQEQYNDFQKYINRCEQEEQNKFIKLRDEIINSGIEYSKDELKYNKMI